MTDSKLLICRTYTQIGSYLNGAVRWQEASVAGQFLNTKSIQYDLVNSERRVLAFRSPLNTQLISKRAYKAAPSKTLKSRRENTEIQNSSPIKMAVSRSNQQTIAPRDTRRSTRLEITKSIRSTQPSKLKYYSTCPHCSIQICLPKDMERHLKTKHGRDGIVYYCPVPSCKRSRSQLYPFDRLDNWRRHVQVVHKIPRPKDEDADAAPSSQGWEM